MVQNARNNYYHDLYELAADMNSALDRDHILHSIVQNVTRAMKAKGCSIMLITPDRKSIVHTISHGLSDSFIDKGPRQVEKSLPEILVGSVAIIEEVAAEGSRVHYPEAATEEGIVSILAVPMTLRDNIIGELRVYTAERRHFSEDDVYFAKAAANLGAIALDNAQLHASIEKAYEGLQQDFISFRFGRGRPATYG
jgi:signal transduction protein with GAF and PtsI domain